MYSKILIKIWNVTNLGVTRSDMISFCITVNNSGDSDDADDDNDSKLYRHLNLGNILDTSLHTSLCAKDYGEELITFHSSMYEERVTVENEEQADLPTHSSNIAEEEVMGAGTKILKEVAGKESEVDDFKTFNGPRKSGRQTREPTWLKDYHKDKGKSGACKKALRLYIAKRHMYG